MAAKYLLDSTVIIDHLKGIKQAVEWVNDLEPDEAVLSVVTRSEVLTKAGDDWDRVAAFLDEYACLSVGIDEADLAAGLRAKYSLKLPDAFQAALARENELALVTRDVADFKKIDDLDVNIPYKV